MGTDVIDHRKDQGRMVQPLLTRAPGLVPRLSKYASPGQDVYGWQEEYLFPVSTPQDAALSFIYMGAQIDRVPKHAQERVVKAAIAHRLDTAEMLGHVRALPRTTKTAAPVDPPELYAIPSARRLRMADRSETAKAAEAVVRYSRQLGFEKTAEAAVRVVQRAGQLRMGVGELPAGVYKAAGMTACDPAHLADQITARANVAPSLEWRAVYSKLASAAHADYAAGKVSTRAHLTKVAGALEALDTASGLSSMWGTVIEDPCSAVFNTPKLAADTIDCGGTAVSLSRLANMPKETLEDVLGEEFVEEVTDEDGSISAARLAEIVPTLPLPMRRALATNLGPAIQA